MIEAWLPLPIYLYTHVYVYISLLYVVYIINYTLPFQFGDARA